MSKDSEDLLSEDILGNDSSFLESSLKRISFPRKNQISRQVGNYNQTTKGRHSKKYCSQDKKQNSKEKVEFRDISNSNSSEFQSKGSKNQYHYHKDKRKEIANMKKYYEQSPMVRNIRSQSAFVPNEGVREIFTRGNYSKREPTPTGKHYSPPIQNDNLIRSQRYGRPNVPHLKDLNIIKQNESVRESLSMRGDIGLSQGRYWSNKSRDFSSKKKGNQEFSKKTQHLRVDNEEFDLMDSTISAQNTIDGGRGTDLMNDTDPSSLQMFVKGPINNTSISNHQDNLYSEHYKMSPIDHFGKSGLRDHNIDSPVQHYRQIQPIENNIISRQKKKEDIYKVDPLNLPKFKIDRSVESASTPNIKKKSLIKKMNPGSFKKLKPQHTPTQNIKNKSEVSEFRLNRNKSLTVVSNNSKSKKNPGFISGKSKKEKKTKALNTLNQSERNSNLKRGGRFSMNRSKTPGVFHDSKRRSLSYQRKETLESEKFKATQVQLRRDLDKKSKELRKLKTQFENLKGNFSALKAENGRLQTKLDESNSKFTKVPDFILKIKK